MRADNHYPLLNLVSRVIDELVFISVDFETFVGKLLKKDGLSLAHLVRSDDEEDESASRCHFKVYLKKYKSTKAVLYSILIFFEI